MIAQTTDGEQKVALGCLMIVVSFFAGMVLGGIIVYFRG